MVALRLPWSGLLVAFVVTVAAETDAETESDFEYDSLVADYPDYYSDEPYWSYYEPALGNTILHKCLCGLDEIWNGEACEKHDTIVVVLEQYSGIRTVVNTTSFGNVTIGEVVCPEGTRRFDLNLNHDYPDHFFVLETGELDWNTIVFGNYCVEHTYSSSNQSINWHGQICLEPPTVPRCCPTGHSMNPDGSCVSSRPFNFSPPVMVSNQHLTWPSVTTEVRDISCTESQDQFVLELNNSTVMVDYHPQAPQLLWTSPFVIRENQATVDYCIGVEAGSEWEPTYSAKLCYKDPRKEHEETCQGKTCVRKCCEASQVLSLQGCIPDDNATQLFNPQYHDPSSLSEVDEPGNITMVHGMPLCKSFFLLKPHESKDDDFFLLKNGYLHAPAFPELYPPSRYCIDVFLGINKEVRMLSLLCFEDGDKDSAICTNVQTYLYPVLLIVSIVFLAITLFVYLCVTELHAKVHGKCLLSHVSALLMAYVNLFIVQQTTTILQPVACKIMASVTHFSFLAAFFWLNVMCFDIWWTLKSMRPVPETGELSRLRFKLYSLYSWGCPMVITIVSVIIQSLPEEMDVIRPDFGKSKCWFNDKISLWAYFYGFVLVLVIANIIFFCQVAYILIVAQNDPILQRTRQQNRERMWLYVKLFLVMGITWLAEIISWQEETCEAWIITDIINSLQGVSIFIIFICKRNLLKKVRGRWEPYLRHVKEVVGSKRLSHSKFSTSGTGHTAREQLSFSSSENRPNHSAASRRTVESQLSIDPSSVNRKISNGSLNSTTGVQVHTQSSIPMDTIAEATTPEGGPNHTCNDSVTVPVDTTLEGTDQHKTKNQNMNGNIKRIHDLIIEEVPDEKEMQNASDTEDVQTSSNLNNNEDSEKAEPLDEDIKGSESVKDEESPVNESGDTEPKIIEEDKKGEISINGSIIPVYYPKENNDLESNYVYPYTQENQGFTVDEVDEPIHV